ncbi:MAG: hypothetical protein IJO69_04260 [Ruminiclostridium sp.]|nr:hypothetical protein [Ruminiclostridium sp.]MBQ9933029.1 hypothetical protein [Ruminiclostridium sp.]
MKNMRMMNTPEDYKALGVNPNRVEAWEDGRRNTDELGRIEWWYFDADMEDGTKVGVNFATNPPFRPDEAGYHPFVYYNIQFPDGSVETDARFYDASECSFGAGNCDVRCGVNVFRGDLSCYELHVEHEEKGISIDLTLESTVTPWRPGTAYMGKDDGNFFTWLCAVPRGSVSGSITCGGKRVPVQGVGYHDHQWGTSENYQFWNRWFWGRQQTGEYTVLLFDLVSARDTDHVQFPLFCVQDGKGNVLIDNVVRTDDVAITVEGTRPQQGSGKLLPDVSRYCFKQGDMEAVYTLKSGEEFVYTNHYDLTPEEIKVYYDELGVYPTFSRFRANGHLVLKRGGDVIADFSGDMHYEISSLWANYVLDAADCEAIQAADPVEESRKLRERAALAAAQREQTPIDGLGAPDPELAGVYDAVIATPMGKQRGQLIFQVEGTVLTGTMDFMGRTYRVENGIATAEGFSYEINAKVMLRKMHAVVRGRRTGDAVEGTLTAPMGSIAITGTRRK